MNEGQETCDQLDSTLVTDVCGQFLQKDVVQRLYEIIRDMKFIPGGRYLYYAGRSKKFFNNCYLLRAEADTREDWETYHGRLKLPDDRWWHWSRLQCLPPLWCAEKLTGGSASGPIPKMNMINESGRRVMQDGSRRSAIYASLHWPHGDIMDFQQAKDWQNVPVGTTGKSLWDIKQEDFNFPAPLDQTNIFVNYDDKWLMQYFADGDLDSVFIENVHQAMRTVEPGFSFNF